MLKVFWSGVQDYKQRNSTLIELRPILCLRDKHSIRALWSPRFVWGECYQPIGIPELFQTDDEL